MKTFHQFLESVGSSWLVALIYEDRINDLNIVYGIDENQALKKAMQYVNPQYMSSITPVVIAKVEDPDVLWMKHFRLNQKQLSHDGGTDEFRERFVRKWFPLFKWS